MPLPRELARFNRSVTNRLTRPLAARLGGFAVIRHVGRKSGREYETPVNAWRHGDWLVVPLTYGTDVDWLKNAKSAQESEFSMMGKTVHVGRPVDLTTHEGMKLMPAMVRRILPLINVERFVDFPVLNPTI